MGTIDYVITYVDSSDPIWRKEYNEYSPVKIKGDESERFRSWDNLRYNLRGVEKFLPFINKVYLVVSGPSQVPDWVNREKVNIIYHKDFIPEKFLPVFCSTSIEMFLGLIPGLSEQFLYANDDTFVVKPCSPEDFFVDGKPVLNYRVSTLRYLASSQYEKQLHNSMNLAENLSKKKLKGAKCLPSHTINPMLVSTYKKVWSMAGKEIEKVVGKFRTDNDFNQYLFSYYDYLLKNYTTNHTHSKYINFTNMNSAMVRSHIVNPTQKLLCINDANVKDFQRSKDAVNAAFQELLPKKSLYETNDIITETKKKDEKELIVHLYTLCWNEREMLPFAVDYWKSVADEIYVLDNGSTDGSVEYLEKIPNITVIPFKTDGFNDEVHKKLKNNVWKASVGKADFVIVCDLDEFLYAKEGVRELLKEYRRRGETIVKPIGYNMISETFPAYEKGKYLWDLVPTGYPDNDYCKCIVFNPNAIENINYIAGAHNCRPIGKVHWAENTISKRMKLLHYKFLSLEYNINRYKILNDRLSDNNIKHRWGLQYKRPIERLKKDFANNLKKSVKIL